MWESLTKQTPEAPLKWSKSRSSTLLFFSLKIDTRNIVSKCTGNLCLQLNNLSDFMLCVKIQGFVKLVCFPNESLTCVALAYNVFIIMN